MLISVENKETMKTVVPTHICMTSEIIQITTSKGTFQIQDDREGGLLLHLGAGIDKLIVIPSGPGIQLRPYFTGNLYHEYVQRR